MDKIKLSKILADHKLWLADEGGKLADLSGADLSGADLRLANLRLADLRGASLCGTNLRWANLRDANLRNADLCNAILCNAVLNGTNLSGANLDFACWPLWCGSVGVKVDRKIAAQLAVHFCAVDCDDPDYRAARASILEFARSSHRAKELGLIEDGE